MSRRLVAPVVTSVVSLFVAIGLQLVLPAIMLSRWGSAGYSLVITIQGLALYVSVADFGVQAFVTRTLAVSVARGELSRASATASTAFKTLAILSTLGCLVVTAAFLLLGSKVRAVVAPRAGVTAVAMTVAFFAQTLSAGAGVVLSGWSTSVESATGRYQRVQVIGLIRTSAYVLSLVSMAAVRAGPATALVVQALTMALFDTIRMAFARKLLPGPDAHEQAPSPLRLLAGARGSLFLAFGGATQNGLQPALTAVLSENAAAAAIPARTLANGARTVAMAVSNVLWVPLAARLTRDARPGDSFLMWRRASPALSTLVLGGIALLLSLAPAIVPHWLPRQSATILAALPFFAAEQAAFLAAFPSIMLLQAVGSFGHIGAVTVAAAICGLALTYLLVPGAGAAGFGLAGLLATSCIFAPGLVISEHAYWRRSGVQAKGLLLGRGALSLLAIVACLAYSRWRVGSSLVLLAVTAGCLMRWRPWQWLFAAPAVAR